MVEPAEPRIVTAWPALPRMIQFAVRLEPVTQVGQEIVPVVVIVPPLIGEVVAIELTEPVPPGTAHVPSPRQKVVFDADVPLFRLVIGRFPVTPPLAEDARLIGGMSLESRIRNVGAFEPVVGPDRTV